MNLAGAVIIGTRCHYCQKFFPPKDVLRFGESIDMCVNCHAKHRQALESLADGTPPKECAECGTSWDTLAARELTESVPMYFHMDARGIGFMLCKDCDKRFVEGHKEMYRPTRHGWDLKI